MKQVYKITGYHAGGRRVTMAYAATRNEALRKAKELEVKHQWAAGKSEWRFAVEELK